MYIYTYTHTHTHAYVCIYAHINAYAHIRTHAPELEPRRRGLVEKEAKQQQNKQAKASNKQATSKQQASKQQANAITLKTRWRPIWAEASSQQFSGFGQVGTHHRVRNSEKCLEHVITLYTIGDPRRRGLADLEEHLWVATAVGRKDYIMCIYIYIYIYMYVYMHTYTYVCIYTYIYIYTHTYTHMCMYIYIYIYMLLYMCTLGRHGRWPEGYYSCW